jgi:hypothetical protein
MYVNIPPITVTNRGRFSTKKNQALNSVFVCLYAKKSSFLVTK